MRRILFVILMFVAFYTYAQNNEVFNVSDDGSIYFLQIEPGTKSSSGIAITDDKLNDAVQKYLENTFNKHLKRRDLKVTELSNITNWNKSTNEILFLDVQAKFVNFPINKRVLSGRLETVLAVRKETGLRKQPGIEAKDNKDINITLFVDDQLSDELRNAMVIDYINKKYEYPMDPDFNKERVETYPDKIYSYVLCVINKDSIIYLRAIFERRKEIVEKTDIFTIKETPWMLTNAEERFKRKFPNNNKYIKDIREDMFEPMRSHHVDTYKEGNPNKSLSKIEFIKSSKLMDANNGMIKLEMELRYLMDWHGFLKSYKRYDVILNIYYSFNFESKEWEYQSIEDKERWKIRPVK